jgi:hypothetical protein
MTTDLRFAKLRTLLKADPYGLLCRLYDFAAAMQQDGDLSQIDAAVLAHRLDFKGTGTRLRKILTQAGYLDEQTVIVGWHDHLFHLFSSIREQNRERGKKSAAMRAQHKTQAQLSPTADKRTPENRRGEERTATVKRSVERPVETATSILAPSFWPNSLSFEQIAEIERDTGKTADFITAKWPAYRDKKIRFGDDYANGNGLAGFRDVLREAKVLLPVAEKQHEPQGWIDWANVQLPHEDDPAWGTISGAISCRNFSYLPASWQTRARQELAGVNST